MPVKNHIKHCIPFVNLGLNDLTLLQFSFTTAKMRAEYLSAVCIETIMIEYLVS